MSTESTRKWRKAHPEKSRKQSRLDALVRSGLNREVARQYLTIRENVFICDICQQKCPSGNNLALDHNHKTKEIRGLLCVNCNRGLGNFKDSILLLGKAIEYLK